MATSSVNFSLIYCIFTESSVYHGLTGMACGHIISVEIIFSELIFTMNNSATADSSNTPVMQQYDLRILRALRLISVVPSMRNSQKADPLLGMIIGSGT